MVEAMCPAAPSSTSIRTRMRVLLADDHPAVLTMARRLLEPEFDVVADVSDGASAFESTLDLEPDVVVLDISMPAMDGFEVARRIARSRSAARVVFLSVHDDGGFRREAEACGGRGYVAKACMRTDLAAAVRGAAPK